MSQDNISSWLNSAVSGDRQARDELIAYYRPFILKEAQRVCRRPLQWGHDDELSIALIAFDEAIDAYKKSKGGSFNLLCRLVIKRRLIDYFRQVEKHDDIPDTDRLVSSAVFNEDWERSEREREIEKYSQLLNDFNLSFEQVAKAQPRHNKTRETLRHVAKILSGDKVLMGYLYSNKNLPKGRLCELAGVTPRILDRGRTYVIALALLISRDDLPHLQSYAQELVKEGGILNE